MAQCDVHRELSEAEKTCEHEWGGFILVRYCFKCKIRDYNFFDMGSWGKENCTCEKKE